MEDKTFITTSNCSICKNCINRIFNPDVPVNFCKGSINTDTVFLLPFAEFDKVDIKDTEKILSDVYFEITGLPIYNNGLVTRTIRCRNVPNYNTYIPAAHRCRMITYDLLNKIKCKHLFVFGNAWECMFDSYPIRHLQNNNMNIYCNYSPGVAFYDAGKYTIFKQQLAEDINLANNL